MPESLIPIAVQIPLVAILAWLVNNWRTQDSSERTQVRKEMAAMAQAFMSSMEDIEAKREEGAKAQAGALHALATAVASFERTIERLYDRAPASS